ncbi:MAG: TonB-dependent receptor [Caulobacteraceae bacterium]|nr:TonB-dependent receptor [Caulobacteraceae bacterium]
MIKRALAIGVCAAFACAVAPASAQEEPTPGAEVSAPSVTPYPAAFFAEFHPVSAMEMIGKLPGFGFRGGSDARGFAGTGGNVLIDGERPPSRNDSLSSVLDRIPANTVLRIDLVRGGAGGIDMQGHTVVANVIRKPAGGLQGTLATTLQADEFGGFFPYAQLQLQKRYETRSIEGSLTLNSNDFSIRARGERIGPDGTLLRRFKHEGHGHELSYAGTGVYEGPLAGGRLRLNTKLSHVWVESTNPNRLLVPGGVELDLFRVHNTEGELGLRYNRPLPYKASLELVAFQQLSDESFIDTFSTAAFQAGTQSMRRAGESIADAKLKVPLSGALNLETGVEGVFNFVDNGSAFTVDGSGLSLSGDSGRVEELRTEAFVAATWRPRPKLSIEGGIRYEHSTITAEGTAGRAEKTLGFPKPRAVLTWSPNQHHQLLLRVERSVGQLDFGSFSASASFATGIFGVGNPDIEPDKAWTYEARYEYRFAGRGSVLLQYTHDNLSDLLSRVVVAIIPPGETTPRLFDITRNLSTATRNTLVFNTDLPLDKIGMTGGLLALRTSWQNQPGHDPVTGVPRNLSGTQASSWSVNLSQNLERLKISWNVGVSSGANVVFYSPRSINSVDNPYRVGGSITWRPRDKLSLTAGVNNANGGYNRSSFVLFDAPRPGGSPAYTETSRGYNKSQVWVSMRKSF